MTDLITRNLKDQSGNLGAELVVRNQAGNRSFVDVLTGQPVVRGIAPDAFELSNSPLDNSFQLDPQSFNVSKALWEQPGVPTTLSRLFGAITAVTAKEISVGSNQVFSNGVCSDALLANINFFRTVHSQIGVNDGDPRPPYLNNLMLGSKIFSQTR